MKLLGRRQVKVIKQEEFTYNRKEYQFCNKKIVIIENHNFVLPTWAEYCAKLEKEYRLITIDYHMDTRPIFSRYACQVCNGDIVKVNDYIVQRELYDKYIKYKYDFLKIEELARKYVYHDEHIMVGYNMGYLSDFYCICKDREDYTEGYKHYFVMGEDTGLIQFCDEAMKKEYMLDIDLDFFNTREDCESNREILEKLVRGTDIITIARENRYFDYLREDCEWTNDIALKRILSLIERVAEK